MKRFLPLLLLAVSSAVPAETGSYLVEVIVFRNLSSVSVGSITPELRSFDKYPDLLDGRAAVTAETIRNDLPDGMRIPAEKSSTMNDAWQRLRSSQDYQPLVYAAWEQNRIDYYPPMRIHDQQVIDTELRPPTQIVVADLTAPDPLAAYRSTFYQLDGSLHLRRSRFLHIFLDLEFRTQSQQNTFGGVTPETGGIAAGTQSAADSAADSAAERGRDYGVFALRQNSRISIGEMQYFDTPFYGALVYVTVIP